MQTVHPGVISTFVPVNHPYGMPGCTNGRSGQTDAILLVTAAHAQRVVEHDTSGGANVFEVVLWKPCGNPAAHIRPVAPAPAGSVGYMAGGNTVDVANLPADVAAAVREHGVTADTLAIHDRSESVAQYAALSSD